jgi:hypothetical protein
VVTNNRTIVCHNVLLLFTGQNQTLTWQMPHPEGTSLRDPSKLFYQSDYNRRLIIGSYWIVIILAIPLWWSTTSIERLSLPTSRVKSQAGKELRFPVQIQLDGVQDPSLSASLQHLLDDRIRKSPQAWKGLDVKVRNRDGVYISTEMRMPLSMHACQMLMTCLIHIPLRPEMLHLPASGSLCIPCGRVHVRSRRSLTA